MKLKRALTLAAGSLTLVGMAAILPAQAQSNMNQGGQNSMDQMNNGNVGDVYRDDVRPEGNNTPNTIQRIDNNGVNNDLYRPSPIEQNGIGQSQTDDGNVGDVYQNDVRPENGNTPSTTSPNTTYPNTTSPSRNTPNTINRNQTDGGNVFDERNPNSTELQNRQTGFPDSPQTSEGADVGDVYNSNMGPERSNVMRLQNEL